MFHRAGVRGDPCGALRHKGHHVHPLRVLLPQHRDWSSEFQDSGFKLLNNFKLFSDFNEVQTYFLMMIGYDRNMSEYL